jgi:hypothetical protein
MYAAGKIEDIDPGTWLQNWTTVQYGSEPTSFWDKLFK